MRERRFALRWWTRSALTAVAFAVMPVVAGEQVPVATIEQLHIAMITPASNALFQADSEAPKNDQAWDELGKSALVLAESANLLLVKGRAIDANKWERMASDLRVAAVAAVEAIKQKNTDKLFEANGAIVAACENCHEPYRDNGRRMM